MSIYKFCGGTFPQRPLVPPLMSERKQSVCIRGTFSDWVSITSSVPQGSVLGPTLFLIFVNDMPNIINSTLLMFADDTKLYHTITSPHDCNILQQDIDQISTWGDHSLMSFNFDKCHVMTFGKSDGLQSCSMKKSDNPLLLNRCNEEHDLGILFTPNLKFSQHINQIAHILV